MKYRALTKEQLEGLHIEFAQFLASQEIDVKEWNSIKDKNPALVEKEINLFSDMVWEDVLKKTNYIEHFSKDMVNFFKCDEEEIHRIVVKINKNINILEQDGFEWLLQNANDDAVELFIATKPYKEDRNAEIFELIESGGNVAKGELYDYFNRLITV